MNEEYLWSKTGEDAEIEKLEKSLQKFRYLEKSAPRVSADNTKKKRFDFSRTWLFVPVAACLLLIVSGLSFVFENKQNIDIGGFNEKAEVRKTNSAPDVPSVVKESPQIFPETTLSKKENAATTKVLYKVPKKSVVPKITNERWEKRDKSKLDRSNPTTILTKEEKYAYDQLMTALAITGSKLKQVQDKIYGAENQTSER